MAVQIKDYTTNILGSTKQRSSVFLRLVEEAVVNEARPNTPKDKGNLRQDVLKTVNGLKGKIEWRKVYAQYQERGMRRDGSHKVKNYTTGGTGPHFAENAIKKVAGSATTLMKLAHLI